MIYRTICTQLWTDKKVQQLSVQGKCLFVYLITNPHTHLSGIYYLPGELITKEVGLSGKQLDTLFDTLSHSSMAFHDHETSTVFIRRMFSYQGRGDKNERSCAKQLESLHGSILIVRFLEEYPSVKSHCSDTLLDSLSTLSKRCPPVPDPVSDSDAVPKSDLKSKSHSEFEVFWEAYPKKIGKKAALQAWKKATDKPPIGEVLKSIDAAKTSEQWTKDHGQFIPHPATWLNQGRWADQAQPKPLSTTEAFLARGVNNGTTRISRGLAAPDHATVGETISQHGRQPAGTRTEPG